MSRGRTVYREERRPSFLPAKAPAIARRTIRAGLRLARRKDGASQLELPKPTADVLLAMGLVREVEVRLANLAACVIERRYRTTPRGEFWLDDDADPACEEPGK